jgi:hypothetical protein
MSNYYCTNKDFKDFINFIIKSHKKGVPASEMYKTAVSNYNYNSSLSAFRKYIYSILKRKNNHVNESSQFDDSIPIDNRFLDLITKLKVAKIVDMCNELHCSPNIVYELVDYFREKGYEMDTSHGNVIFSTLGPRKEYIDQISRRSIIFAVVSDPHFGSTSVQITALNEFAEICRKKGIKHILCPGDVVTGNSVYRGQLFDIYAMTAEEQESSAIRNLPNGFEWYAIGGNHDYSFIKNGGGHNPLLSIASKRPDFHYLGYDEADIPLLDNVTAKLWHPSGGVPYSLSYRLQKGVEQVALNELSAITHSPESRPTTRFVFCGHLHIEVQAMFGPIFGACCGTFEGKTNYLKRKGLTPAIGGWIIQADLKPSNGYLLNFESKFYCFDEIQDDWKNYDHSLIEIEKLDHPILE